MTALERYNAVEAVVEHLAPIVAVLFLILLGTVVIGVAVMWMTNPWAQSLTVGAGVLFVGAAAAGAEATRGE